QHEVFDGFGLPPIPRCKARSEKPEKRSESQGAGGPVDGDEVNDRMSRRTARLPHCVGSGNRCGLLSGAGIRRSQSIFRKCLVRSWAWSTLLPSCSDSWWALSLL